MHVCIQCKNARYLRVFPTQSMSAPAFSTGTKMRSTNSWFSVFSQSFMQCHLPQRAMFHRWPNRWQMVVSDWDYASDLEYFWEVLTPSSPSRNQETGRRGIQCFPLAFQIFHQLSNNRWEFSSQPHGIRQVIRTEIVESWEVKLIKPRHKVGSEGPVLLFASMAMLPHGYPWKS